MRFGFTFIPDPKGAPSWFQEFKNHYDQVITFMSRFTTQGISVKENVQGNTFRVTAQHKQEKKISHNLSNTPNIISAVGRMSLWTITNRDQTSITFLPVLMGTTRDILPIGQTLISIPVKDTLLFREGDRILIGSQVRTIRRIENSTFRLDAEIIVPNDDSITLFEETIEIAIY